MPLFPFVLMVALLVFIGFGFGAIFMDKSDKLPDQIIALVKRMPHGTTIEDINEVFGKPSNLEDILGKLVVQQQLWRIEDKYYYELSLDQ